MRPRLYELCWQIETDAHSFIYREFKVSHSDVQATEYGKKREVELNENTSIEERSQNGFYFKYLGAYEVKDIDGFIVQLKSLKGER